MTAPHIHVALTREPIVAPENPADAETGAVVVFEGLVRGHEDGKTIGALVYEAYERMAAEQMRRAAEALLAVHSCHSVAVVHRLGTVPVGEAAVYVRAGAKHRAEAIAFVAGFMNHLKAEVPIWKSCAIPGTKAPQA